MYEQGVYGGGLHIHNSTLSSETSGLHLGLGEAALTLRGFPASPTGIDYWHLDEWSLGEEGAPNVTLDDVYLRNMRLDVDGGDVEVIDVEAPLEITCGGDSLTVTGSAIEGIRLESGCALAAGDVSLTWLEAWAASSASLSGATVQRSESHDRSVVTYTLSTVDSLSCGGGVVLMCGSPLPEDLLVEGDSVVIYFSGPVSAAPLRYDAEDGILDIELDGLEAEMELMVVLDRGRVRRGELAVLLDGEPVDHGVSSEKGLSYVSSRVSPGVGHVSVVLGAPPPERVPFLETLVGRRLVTLLLVLLLVVFVLLTWR